MSTPTAQIIKGACPHDCPATCALEYHVANGKLIDVKGSATHSLTVGVPRKKGAKGEGKFVPIS